MNTVNSGLPPILPPTTGAKPPVGGPGGPPPLPPQQETFQSGAANNWQPPTPAQMAPPQNQVQSFRNGVQVNNLLQNGKLVASQALLPAMFNGGMLPVPVLIETTADAKPGEGVKAFVAGPQGEKLAELTNYVGSDGNIYVQMEKDNPNAPLALFNPTDHAYGLADPIQLKDKTGQAGGTRARLEEVEQDGTRVMHFNEDVGAAGSGGGVWGSLGMGGGARKVVFSEVRVTPQGQWSAAEVVDSLSDGQKSGASTGDAVLKGMMMMGGREAYPREIFSSPNKDGSLILKGAGMDSSFFSGGWKNTLKKATAVGLGNMSGSASLLSSETRQRMNKDVQVMPLAAEVGQHAQQIYPTAIGAFQAALQGSQHVETAPPAAEPQQQPAGTGGEKTARLAEEAKLFEAAVGGLSAAHQEQVQAAAQAAAKDPAHAQVAMTATLTNYAGETLKQLTANPLTAKFAKAEIDALQNVYDHGAAWLKLNSEG